MKEFYGRREELREIGRALSSDRFESILLYGRRRVGKTVLIDEAAKAYHKRIIRYECKKTTNSQNLKDFTNYVNQEFNDNQSLNSFDELFDYLLQKSIEEEYLLIIDEFSFLLQGIEAVDSALAIAIDKYKTRSKIKMIISGSYVQILKNMISGNAHLFGRFTHIISLKPMDYYDSSCFYSSFSNEDKIKMYAVFGGIPYFNSLIDERLSADENIMELLVKSDSILEHEINEVVLRETNKIAEMNMIINMIALGTTKYSDMVAIASKDGIRIDYYLKKLIEMGIIEKLTPINDPNNKKKTFYVFKDNLMHFYYRYLFDNSYIRSIMDTDVFFDKKIRKDFEEEYIPKKFEGIAKEYLILANKKGEIEELFYNIGTYFFDDRNNKRNVQFDVVTMDDKGYISYECKYSKHPIDNRVIKEEENQTINIGMNIYKLGFISRSGFDDNVNFAKYNCISLDDLYQKDLK